jgi:dihydrodipicolinate synthase/N-acetylneuraminate lyase
MWEIDSEGGCSQHGFMSVVPASALKPVPVDLIDDPSLLKPDTPWSATVWAHQPEEALVDHEARARLCVAALLPFKDRKPDWEGFVRSIDWMRKAGEHYGVEMAFVLNADTGYIFDLSMEEYREVLRRFREAFPDQKFLAGVTARDAGESEFKVERYLPMIEAVQEHENCEVMIMTSRTLNVLDPQRRRDAYFEIAEHLTRPGIVHALEPAFVPWATPYEPWLLHELALHPKFVGGKISTLDEPHFLYWASMCKSLKLDFAPHSGDDFGICTAIRLGLPLLIGAGVSACPLICAAKAMWRETGGKGLDTNVYKLFEAIQSFEDQVFRLDEKGSAAAYKHSTAHVLRLLGLIDSAETHPNCADRRPEGEEARMREAMVRPARVARRLGIAGWPV